MCLDLEGSDIDTILDSLKSLKEIMKKHNLREEVVFDETYLKIELK